LPRCRMDARPIRRTHPKACRRGSVMRARRRMAPNRTWPCSRDASRSCPIRRRPLRMTTPDSRRMGQTCSTAAILPRTLPAWPVSVHRAPAGPWSSGQSRLQRMRCRGYREARLPSPSPPSVSRAPGPGSSCRFSPKARIAYMRRAGCGTWLFCHWISYAPSVPSNPRQGLLSHHLRRILVE
jgi:hypothetical protein